MEQDPDIDAPDQDTELLAAVQPAAPTPSPGGAALEDAETVPLAVAVGDLSAVDTMQLATRAASDPSLMDTIQPDALAARDPSLADTVIETPAVLMPAIRAPVAASDSHSHALRFVWRRHPEFWIAVALATFLRLWHINLAPFRHDQAALMLLARGAWVHGALPITGIPSSLGPLDAPLSVYLLMPFALFGKNPLAATISIALWNVVGVAFCYIFAHRYFGRIVAASGALLFASCATAVHFSQFIWQLNYLPPILALWMLTLYIGCVSGRRGWFVPHIVLLALAIQLHPVGALLIPVSLVGFIITPRQAMPSRREWALAVAVVLLLLAPTLLWETLSGGSDLRAFAQYLQRPGGFDLDVFHMLYGILGAPPLGELGPQSLYAQMGSWATVLNIAAVLFFVIGMIVLTERLVRVGVYVWRDGVQVGGATAPHASRTTRARHGAWAVWRGLRAEPTWRAHLLLWLWVVVPIVLLLRHSSDLTTSYLLLIYPAVFIIGGFAVQAAFRMAEQWTPWAAFARQVAPACILTALTVLVLAQAFQAALFPAALATGSFSAFPGYGYPLAEAQQVDTALSTLQAEQNARTIFLTLPESPRDQASIEYLAISEHPDRVGSTANCLLLPAPDEEPALVVATLPAGPANSLLSSLPELTPVANLALAGSDAIAVYQMTGSLPPLLGERTLTPITFADAAGNGLRLDAVALQSDGQLRFRWTVLGSATTGAGTPWYTISAAARSASGATHALPDTQCQPTRWHAGETLFTWAAAGDATDIQAAQLRVYGGSYTSTVQAGSVQLLTGRASTTPTTPLHPSSGAVAPNGALTIPLTTAP
jgi:hypothetical protein